MYVCIRVCMCAYERVCVFVYMRIYMYFCICRYVFFFPRAGGNLQKTLTSPCVGS